MTAALRFAVLASTRGTDLQAIMDSVKDGTLSGIAELACVACDRECGAAEKSRAAGIPTHVLDKTKYASREEYDVELAGILESAGVQLICLAGYKRIFSPFFVKKFSRRIINPHPSLLPAFPGGFDAGVHELVLDYGVKLSGCTFHFVDESVDGGPIIAQSAVPVLDGDTPDSLKERVQNEEKRLFPEIIKLFAEGRLSIDGRHVRGWNP